MKTVVVRNTPRVDIASLDRLAALGVSTVHEAMGRVGLMKPYMRPAWTSPAIAGSAITVFAQPGDNWMLHVAIEQCRPGDVVVVAVTADSTDGMFGELIATSMKAHGVRGLILDAGCRDVRPLREMGFPVWSRAISAKGTVKETLGAVNVPVVCAGAFVRPGDAIVADEDGVVVVPRGEVEKTIVDGEAREAAEAEKRAELATGALNLDLSNMRGKLEKAGLVYVDHAEGDG